jgi:hypothetical protein
VIVDLFGAAAAYRYDIRGEPLGVGRSLDVRRPTVLALWGSALSPPLAALPVVIALRRRPGAERALAAAFALGGMMEPVFWGRRACPRHARALVRAHVGLAAALATLPESSAQLS